MAVQHPSPDATRAAAIAWLLIRAPRGRRPGGRDRTTPAMPVTDVPGQVMAGAPPQSPACDAMTCPFKANSRPCQKSPQGTEASLRRTWGRGAPPTATGNDGDRHHLTDASPRPRVQPVRHRGALRAELSEEDQKKIKRAARPTRPGPPHNQLCAPEQDDLRGEYQAIGVTARRKYSAGVSALFAMTSAICRDRIDLPYACPGNGTRARRCQLGTPAWWSAHSSAATRRMVSGSRTPTAPIMARLCSSAMSA